MAHDVDELDINPFFKALQTKFLDLHEEAQEKCYLICIPQSSSLLSVSFNQTFVENHILRPSPYFKGEYTTQNQGRGGRSVQFSSDGQALKSHDAGSQKAGSHEEIKIISEEQGYNKDYKPYRILIIDHPLFCKVTKDSQRQTQSEKKEITHLWVKVTFNECSSFLRSLTEYVSILKDLDQSLNVFNKNYMVLKEYLSDASQRLYSLSQDAHMKCLKCSKRNFSSNSNFTNVLKSALESYIVGSVHQKIYPIICDKFSDDDDALLKKCQALNGITSDKLGVSDKLACPIPSAVVELANLDGFRTPLEKIDCLKNTMDCISQTVEEFIQQNLEPSIEPTSDDIPCMTTDDLIPILSTVVIQSKCRHLFANIYYMENFYWSCSTGEQDSLSYCLVTFKAAVHFLSSKAVSPEAISAAKNTKEMSINELLQSAQEMKLEEATADHVTRPSNRPMRQIGQITQMLEKSDEWIESQKQKPIQSLFGEPSRSASAATPDVVPLQDPKRKKEQLGDFLTSLEDDVFGSAFGKL